MCVKMDRGESGAGSIMRCWPCPDSLLTLHHMHNPQPPHPPAKQVEDIVNTAAIFKGVSYFKSCEEPS